MNIDTDEREDHFLGFDLIDRAQTFVEMRWRINMSTPLTEVGEKLPRKNRRLPGLVVFRTSKLSFVPRPENRASVEFPDQTRALNRRTFC